MFANLNGMHLLILVAVLLLLFGATKLPALARGVGQSVRILRSETRALDADDEAGVGASAKTADAASPGRIERTG